MIRPLRRRHYRLWCLWAFLLPLGLLCAIAWRPHVPERNNLSDRSIGLSFKLQPDSTTSLELSLAEPLTTPTCLVFVVATGHDVLLGKINHQGVYSFPLPRATPIDSIKLYDPIQGKIMLRQSPSQILKMSDP